jgi:hypothetical protein
MPAARAARMMTWDDDLVEVLRERLHHLIAVLGANLVVVLHFVDVGDEDRRDQDVIEGDDALVVT